MKTFYEIGRDVAERSKDIYFVADSEGDYLARSTIWKVRIERLGRDLKVYDFLAKVQGMDATIPIFLMEVGLPFKQPAPATYAMICDHMLDLAREVYTEDQYREFKACL